jgi:excisionase family DNA binding protein
MNSRKSETPLTEWLATTVSTIRRLRNEASGLGLEQLAYLLEGSAREAARAAAEEPEAAEPNAYTPETLAERWQCSANHVRRVIADGDLEAIRMGRLIRISRKAVAEFEAKPA